MKIELFKESYTSLMMQIVKTFAENEASAISKIILSGNHYQIIEIGERIKMLADAKMLLEIYNESKPKQG